MYNIYTEEKNKKYLNDKKLIEVKENKLKEYRQSKKILIKIKRDFTGIT